MDSSVTFSGQLGQTGRFKRSWARLNSQIGQCMRTIEQNGLDRKIGWFWAFRIYAQRFDIRVKDLNLRFKNTCFFYKKFRLCILHFPISVILTDFYGPILLNWKSIQPATIFWWNLRNSLQIKNWKTTHSFWFLVLRVFIHAFSNRECAFKQFYKSFVIC